MAQVVEHLHDKCKALNSNPSKPLPLKRNPKLKKIKTNYPQFNPFPNG
jgi:hypothetical protein